MFESSPAVDRARAAAVRAAGDDPAAVRLSHWLLGLLAEEEGRPSGLLEKLGVSLESFRAAVEERAGTSAMAPPTNELYAAARELGLTLRADNALTTDFVFLAALSADAAFAQSLAETGVTPQALHGLLRSPLMATTEAAFDGEQFTVTDAPDHTAAARVIDANLNRVREALRVLDDHARFVLNDRFLTERFKTLRHRLTDAAGTLSPYQLLAARDTPGDVGTSVSAVGEYARTSPADVAAANLKRLQESLRSLEEFGKVLSADFGRAVERLRYEAYTLEAAVLRGGPVRERLAHARLYVLLTGSQASAALDWTIAEAAAGGADVFQLREKSLTDRELIDRATRMREWTRSAGVLFVVNDRPDVAKLVGADGVHLGQDDLPVKAARRIVGPDVLIGFSTHSVEQVRRAVLDGADYLGVGPTFPSRTKAFDHFPGLDFVREAVAETSLPAFALGGIDLSNVGQVVEAGAARIAVGSAVATADDPRGVAQALRAGVGNSHTRV